MENLGNALIIPNVIERIEIGKRQNYHGIKENLKQLFFNFIDKVNTLIIYFLILNNLLEPLLSL